MSARMPESDAQDFLARLSRCVVAAHERGDHGTAQVLTEGMAEFERLRVAEPVDHCFRPHPRAPACCAEAGCGRGADEHLAFGLRANLAPRSSPPLVERLRLVSVALRTMAATTSHTGDRKALAELAELAELGPTR